MVIYGLTRLVSAFHGQPELWAKNKKNPEGGFTYLGLMFAIAIAGIALAGTGVVWQMESRREKEKQLLFVGEEYRRAINSYYEKSPGGDKQYPQKLEDLLLDTRSPNIVRHLRRLYPEPMMADGRWELIRQQGRIFGVASRSLEVPIKLSGFSPEQEEFEGAADYSEWRFLANGGGGAATPGGVAASKLPGALDNAAPSPVTPLLNKAR